MNLFTKRLGLVLTGAVGVGAIASLAVGASYALFSATGPTQSQTFAAGTVYFSSGTGGSNDLVPSNTVSANYSVVAPGDFYCGLGGSAQNAGGPQGVDCASAYGIAMGSQPPANYAYGVGGYYQVNYGGSLDAYVGLVASVTSYAACMSDGSAPSEGQWEFDQGLIASPSATPVSLTSGQQAQFNDVEGLCKSNPTYNGSNFSSLVGTEPIWEGDNNNCQSNNDQGCGGPPNATVVIANDAGDHTFTVDAYPTHGTLPCTDYAGNPSEINSCTYSNAGSPYNFPYVHNGNDSVWAAGDAEPIDLIVGIPSDVIPPKTPNNSNPSTNQMQGSSVSVSLNVVAVQAANNAGSNGGPQSWS